MAIKAVGVGSVGTFCAVILMMADVDDPLFLQVKETGTSVLEPYAGKSIYANHGQRVCESIDRTYKNHPDGQDQMDLAAAQRAICRLR